MLKEHVLHRLFAIALAAMLASGCSGRFSTQEAYDTCEGIADRTPTTSEASFADCVDCYERCGADCEQENAEPPDAYVCPDDL